MPPEPLDETNRALIDALIRSPRATHRQLATDLGLNEVTVASRIHRLTEMGAMATTIAVDWKAAGYRHSAYIWVKCTDRSAIDAGTEVASIAGVQNVAVILGAADLFVHVLLAGELESLLAMKDTIENVRGVAVLETSIVLRNILHRLDVTQLPIREPALPPLPDPVIPLDALDVGICEQLASDARQSNREIARLLGTSERTVRARLKRLDESGLIRIVTMIDVAHQTDTNVNAFIGIRTNGNIDDVARSLSAMTCVGSITATTGDADLYVIAAAASSTDLADWLVTDVRSIPGVSSTTTAMIGRSLRFTTRLRRLI